MGTTTALRGHPAWHAEHGTGEPLLYLHGGFSDSRELDPVRERYAARFAVHTLDRRGHDREHAATTGQVRGVRTRTS